MHKKLINSEHMVHNIQGKTYFYPIDYELAFAHSYQVYQTMLHWFEPKSNRSQHITNGAIVKDNRRMIQLLHNNVITSLANFQ